MYVRSGKWLVLYGDENILGNTYIIRLVMPMHLFYGCMYTLNCVQIFLVGEKEGYA